MKKGKHTEEHDIGVLKHLEAGRTRWELGVSEATIYTWKSEYGAINRRPKHMVADLSLDKEALKAVIRTSFITKNAKPTSCCRWIGLVTDIGRGRITTRSYVVS
jgi:putative transposase